MIRNIIYIFVSAIALLFIGSCNNLDKREKLVAENLKAKSMLEGIWLDADGENVTFRIKGDTVYYPDSMSQPVMFKIIADTMIFMVIIFQSIL